jgi:hypothetical protein
MSTPGRRRRGCSDQRQELLLQAHTMQQQSSNTVKTKFLNVERAFLKRK